MGFNGGKCAYRTLLMSFVFLFTGIALRPEKGNAQFKATSANYDVLEEIRKESRDSTYPLTPYKAEFSEKIQVLLERYSKPEWVPAASPLTADEQKLKIEEWIAKSLSQNLKGIQTRLSQVLFEIPGLGDSWKAPEDSPQELLRIPFSQMTAAQKSIALQTLLIDTPLVSNGKYLLTPFQALQQRLGIRTSRLIDPPLFRAASASQLLMIVVTQEEFLAVIGALRDTPHLGGFGYAAHDPVNHRSLILLNEANLGSDPSLYLKVGLHELTHVIQQRYAERNGIDLTDAPKNSAPGKGVKFRSFVLEGMADYTSLELMEKLSDALTPQKEFTDMYALKSSADIKFKLTAILLNKILFESDDATYRQNNSAPLLLALLRASQGEDGISKIFISSSLFPQIYLGDARLMSSIKSHQTITELQDRLLSIERELFNYTDLYIETNLKGLPLFAQRVCGAQECTLSKKSLRDGTPFVKALREEAPAFEFVLQREKDTLLPIFTEALGDESRAEKLFTTAFRDLTTAEKTILVKTLLFDLKAFGRHQDESMANLLVETFVPQNVESFNHWSSLSYKLCVWKENRMCSNGSGWDASTKTGQITIRADGTLTEVMLSSFHELTHHLQYSLMNQLNIDSLPQPVTSLIAEGTASLAAVILPRELANVAKSPDERRAWLYLSQKEENRISEGPYFKGTGAMLAVYDTVSSESWPKAFLELLKITALTGSPLEDAITKITSTMGQKTRIERRLLMDKQL